MDLQKGFEIIVSYAQSLNQWALLIVGGSAVIILRESHRRPEKWWARRCYFLFFPGWAFLLISMYYGQRIYRTYIAYVLTKNPDVGLFLEKTNHLASLQLDYFYYGVICFGFWLAVYMYWWVTAKAADIRSGK